MEGTKAELSVRQSAYVPQFPQDNRRDLLVAHLKGDQASVFDLKGFGYSGSPFVHHGNVYWARGQTHGYLGPTRWKWEGSTFTPLSDSDTTELNQEVADFDDATRTEGWSETSILLGGATPRASFHLRTGDIVVVGESVTR